MTVGILWKDDEPRLLVVGHDGKYNIVNGGWELILDENTLEGYPKVYPDQVKMKFDAFTALTDTIKYKDLSDYNEIINDARELGIGAHKDLNLEQENIKSRELAEQRRAELDKEYDIAF